MRRQRRSLPQDPGLTSPLLPGTSGSMIPPDRLERGRFTPTRRARLAWLLLLILAPPAQAQPPSPAPPPAVPRPTIRFNDNGSAVETLQRLLNVRLSPSPELDIDGDFGAATREAVMRFQRSKNLDPTGVVDRATWDALGPNPPPRDAPTPPPAEINARKSPRKPAEPLEGPPFVTSKAWVVVDGRTGAIIDGHDQAVPLDMASTTKIMTALVVLRQAEVHKGLLDETVVFSERADKTPGSTAGVRAGERLPLRELLYGLLLPSGNDASVALGEHVGKRLGSPSDTKTDPLDRFVAEMNRLAADLQLRETHFVNTHGLTARDHHSSARDLAALARVALRDPLFATCVNTVRRGATLTDAQGQTRNVVWTNTNRLLDTEGYDGVKTGTTNAAGNCLVASGRRGDEHRIIVVLGSGSTEGRYADARNLFRWAWRQPAPGKSPQP
ncbi:MAG: peptidoglycan-binding protein [Isosphaeraceae bacterium]